jgi:hypothetical protein
VDSLDQDDLAWLAASRAHQDYLVDLGSQEDLDDRDCQACFAFFSF